MNRNSSAHFDLAPSVGVSRSTWRDSWTHKFTFNEGLLVPFYCREILPGDSIDNRTSLLCRMSTPLFPVMDDCYLDTYFFFVPNRLVWNHWKNFMGENDTSAWAPTVQYSVPQLTAPSGGFLEGSLADYFPGIPTKVANIKVDVFPFRMYYLIWNEFFRAEAIQAPLLVGEANDTVSNTEKGYYLATTGDKGLLRVGKYRDYFVSALPSPQRGNSVPLPLGTDAPVFAKSYSSFMDPQTGEIVPPLARSKYKALGFITPNALDSAVGDVLGLNYDSTGNGSEAYFSTASGSISTLKPAAPFNLFADLSAATAATVNQIRLAFAMQRFLEKDARGGGRYVELIYTHFGVSNPNDVQQRPEYLGGSHVPINVNQVIQTSATDQEPTPAGNTAAFSKTVDNSGAYHKSFTEHGFVIGLLSLRVKHSYQQGLHRQYSRKSREDYYFPVFANLGEQSVLNKEIYAQGTSVDDQIFGYQEAWAEYRYTPSTVAGAFRSNSAAPLDSWHYADDYNSLPTLSPSWIQEGQTAVDRTLAVSGTTAPQFIIDMAFNERVTRCMPLYSVPGMIDHN